MQAVIVHVRGYQRARCSRWAVVGALCLGGVLVSASSASALDRHASPSNFSSAFSAAQGGDTILLAAGSYGTFSGGSRASMVTLKPESGATASMRVSFNGASSLRLEGLTLTDIDLGGNTNNVTIAGSRVTGHTVIRTSEFNNSRVLLDANTHADIMACGSCYSGGSAPSNYTGFELATGSPGKTNASDGADRGISIDGAPTPTATPTATARGNRPDAAEHGADAPWHAAARRQPANVRQGREPDGHAAPSPREDRPQAHVHARVEGHGDPTRRARADAHRPDQSA